ncbi:MAG: dehydrogenase [Acidobacteriaceae bacterium]|nr:dehydrogenase [Acidobacteriaceae bacterium]
MTELNHQVIGVVRKTSSAARVEALGAVPVIIDTLDAHAIQDCVSGVKPQVVIPQLTAIPAKLDLRHFDREFAMTNRLRTEGTANLMAAAVNVGCEVFAAQSFAGWPYARTGRVFKTEDDELDPNPPIRLKTTLDALGVLEDTGLKEKRIKGIVLRYGAFYGPRSSIALDGAMIDEIRKRRVPLDLRARAQGTCSPEYARASRPKMTLSSRRLNTNSRPLLLLSSDQQIF